MQLTRHTIRAAVVVLAVWLGVAGVVQAQGPEKPLAKVVLQLQWKHQYQFAGYYAAQELGYYREAGLDVRIVEGDGSANDSVAMGQARYGVAGSDVLLMRDHGLPVVVLASIFQHSPLIILAAARPDLGNLHELADKRLMMEGHAAELMAYFAYERIPLSRITMLPHEQGVAPLIEGRTDAMSAYETDEIFELKQAKFPYVIFSPRMAGIDFYGDVLYSSEEEVRENPERVKAFVEASLRGWRYALSHEEKIVDMILGKYSTRHSREHLLFEARETRRLIMPDVVDIGYMSTARWSQIVEFYLEQGLLVKRPNLERMLWRTEARQTLTPYYVTIAGLLLVLGGLGWIIARMKRLNTLVRTQVLDLQVSSERAQAAELRYRVLSENAPFGVVISTLAEGRILHLNPKLAEMWGVNRDFAIGHAITDYYADPQARRVLVERLSETGFVNGFDLEMHDAQGRQFWVSLSATAISYDGVPCVFVAMMDVTERRQIEEEKRKLIAELQEALGNIKTLRGLLPICSACRKIRDDKGYWTQLESYVRSNTDADFSHGICPDCANKLYPDIANLIPPDAYKD